MSSSHFARAYILLVTATLADEFQDHVWAARHWQVILVPKLVMTRIQCSVNSLSFPDQISFLVRFKKDTSGQKLRHIKHKPATIKTQLTPLFFAGR
jgi:hypothetical protein